MLVNQVIDLDMIPGGIMPIVNVNQFDKQSNAVTFNLYKDGAVYTVPSGAGVSVDGTKPDGKGFTYACVLAGDRKSANMALTQQMTAVAGDVICELRIATTSEMVGSRNFILRVERAGLADDTVVSDSDLPVIAHAAEIASELDSYIQTATDAATDASNYANAASASATNAANSAAGVSSIYSDVNTIYNSLATAKTNANNAATAANTIATTLQEKLDNGDFVGAQGPKGDTGDSGVMTLLSGMFTMYVDEDGNLYAVGHTDLSECFDYESDTGNLYYVTDDGETEEET